MGAVYKAEDTTLNRLVAIKALSSRLAEDDEARERFTREAQAASSINHPNITTVHDLLEEDDQHFICMEYVEGKTIRDMAESGQVSVKKAIDIITQAAEALEAAHNKGILHRDVKSANIMVTMEGRVKVMDFGLAHLEERSQLTRTGTTMGTLAYSSPEQITGKPVDKRSEIFSLGVVFYELLAGKLPFPATSEAEIVFAIINNEPERVSHLRDDISEALRGVVERMMEKDPTLRYQNCSELIEDLEAVRSGHETTSMKLAAPPVTGEGIREWKNGLRIVVGAVVIVAVAVIGYTAFRGSAGIERIETGQMQQVTHAPELEVDPALSPDGKFIAYSAGPAGLMHLYVRQIAGGRVIALTDDNHGNCRSPQWSPDGTQIVFRSESGISVIPALGGTPRLLVESPAGMSLYSPAWSPDSHQIAYTVGNAIYVVTIATGDTLRLTDAYAPHSLSWSPDGSRLAYTSGNPGFLFGVAIGNIAPSSIWTVPSTGGEPVPITEDNYLNVSPVWTPDGRYLLFVSNQGGSRDVYQVAVRKSGAPKGPAVRLTNGLNAYTISISVTSNELAYSVFTYKANIWSVNIPDGELVSVSEAVPVTEGSQAIEGIGVSRDGQWLGFDSNRSGNQDIYKLPLPNGDIQQLTSDPSDDFLPSWSPDGREIAFYSFRTGNRDLFVMSPEGRLLQQVTDDPAQERYPDWSTDGNRLVFYSDKSGRQELYIVSRERRDSKWGEPRQITFDGGSSARWSPDGRWIAYICENSLRIISPSGGDQQILVPHDDSAGRANPVFPAWSLDSMRIYYKAFDAESRSSFWSIPVTGGVPRLLVVFDDPSRISIRPEFATDGERLYFTLTQNESDIWITELLRKK